MLERNKHNGFSMVIFKTCYSKNALKGAFLHRLSKNLFRQPDDASQLKQTCIGNVIFL